MSKQYIVPHKCSVFYYLLKLSFVKNHRAISYVTMRGTNYQEIRISGK